MIDTLAKRASAIGTFVPFIWNYPIPDGTLSQGDRQEITYMYSGILAGEFVPPVVSIFGPDTPSPDTDSPDTGTPATVTAAGNYYWLQ